MADYTKKLKSDLLEQFKESPRINALMEAIGEQLRGVSEFYEALRTERGISTGVGQQLDGVGDIVVLSRGEALEMVNTAGLGDKITDELYRNYLFYKILKNTNTCTYPDLIKAFRLFWDKPLYYHEDPETPAVMYLETGTLTIFDHVEDLLTTPVIKAAGVGIHIKAFVQFPEMDSTLRYGGCFSVYVRQPVMEQADTFDFHNTLRIGGEFGTAVRRPIPEIADDIEFNGSIRVGAIGGTAPSLPLPEQMDGLRFQRMLRIGGSGSVMSGYPASESADDIRFQYSIRAGGLTDAAAHIPMPEDIRASALTGLSRTGGQFITHTVIPIPEQE